MFNILAFNRYYVIKLEIFRKKKQNSRTKYMLWH